MKLGAYTIPVAIDSRVTAAMTHCLHCESSLHIQTVTDDDVARWLGDTRRRKTMMLFGQCLRCFRVYLMDEIAAPPS